MAGANEAGIEGGRNNNVGKNETQNRVSEIGPGNSHLGRRSAHLTEIKGTKAGNELCRNLFSKYYMSNLGRSTIFSEIQSETIIVMKLDRNILSIEPISEATI